MPLCLVARKDVFGNAFEEKVCVCRQKEGAANEPICDCKGCGERDACEARDIAESACDRSKEVIKSDPNGVEDCVHERSTEEAKSPKRERTKGRAGVPGNVCDGESCDESKWDSQGVVQGGKEKNVVFAGSLWSQEDREREESVLRAHVRKDDVGDRHDMHACIEAEKPF